MAGDAGGVDPSSAGFVAAAATAIGAALGAFGLWLANRMLGKAAFEAAMTTRFNAIMDQQRALHAEERAMWRSIEVQLNGRIVNLEQTVRSLTNRLQSEGALSSVRPERYGHDPLITIPAEPEE